MRRSTAPAIVSALAALLLYFPSFRYGFVWDDVSLIAENRYLSDPAERWNNLTGDFFRRSGDPDRIGHWRPAVTATFMTDRAAFGDRPARFHLLNAALHAIACALVAAVAIALGLSPLAAGFAGVVFAVHPAHVESVAWISGRTDLLCGLFVAAGLLSELSRSRARIPLAAACTALALLSKEIGVALPLAVALRAWLLPFIAGVEFVEDADGRARTLRHQHEHQLQPGGRAAGGSVGCPGRSPLPGARARALRGAPFLSNHAQRKAKPPAGDEAPAGVRRKRARTSTGTAGPGC